MGRARVKATAGDSFRLLHASSDGQQITVNGAKADSALTALTNNGLQAR